MAALAMATGRSDLGGNRTDRGKEFEVIAHGVYFEEEVQRRYPEFTRKGEWGRGRLLTLDQ
jgi:hypothetical protein